MERLCSPRPGFNLCVHRSFDHVSLLFDLGRGAVGKLALPGNRAAEGQVVAIKVFASLDRVEHLLSHALSQCVGERGLGRLLELLDVLVDLGYDFTELHVTVFLENRGLFKHF